MTFSSNPQPLHNLSVSPRPPSNKEMKPLLIKTRRRSLKTSLT
jgi:hypothetical protein